MYTIQQLAISLAVGAILGLLFGLIAFALRRFTRPLLFIGLVIAAVAYVLFAILLAREAPLWLVVELVGLCVYGTMGMLGLRGSPWWLVAGWGLHSLWDIVLHYFGPGRTFVPALGYTLPCLSFDLVVAGFIAYQIARGSHPAIKPVLHGEAP